MGIEQGNKANNMTPNSKKTFLKFQNLIKIILEPLRIMWASEYPGVGYETNQLARMYTPVQRRKIAAEKQSCLSRDCHAS